MKEAIAASLDDARRFNLKLFGFTVHRIIFPVSIAVTLILVLMALSSPVAFGQAVDGMKAWILQHADWYIMVIGNLVVLFCFGLALSLLGKIRLGGENATPEYGTFSWGAMLFAAGMGLGLIF